MGVNTGCGNGVPASLPPLPLVPEPNDGDNKDDDAGATVTPIGVGNNKAAAMVSALGLVPSRGMVREGTLTLGVVTTCMVPRAVVNPPRSVALPPMGVVAALPLPVVIVGR